jgi:hypothetical protein
MVCLSLISGGGLEDRLTEDPLRVQNTFQNRDEN